MVERLTAMYRAERRWGGRPWGGSFRRVECAWSNVSNLANEKGVQTGAARRRCRRIECSESSLEPLRLFKNIWFLVIALSMPARNYFFAVRNSGAAPSPRCIGILARTIAMDVTVTPPARARVQAKVGQLVDVHNQMTKDFGAFANPPFANMLGALAACNDDARDCLLQFDDHRHDCSAISCPRCYP